MAAVNVMDLGSYLIDKGNPGSVNSTPIVPTDGQNSNFLMAVLSKLLNSTGQSSEGSQGAPGGSKEPGKESKETKEALPLPTSGQVAVTQAFDPFFYPVDGLLGKSESQEELKIEAGGDNVPAVNKEGIKAGLNWDPLLPQEKQNGLFPDESLRDGSFTKAGDEGRKNPVLTDSIDPGSTNGIIPNAPAVNKEGIKAGVSVVPLMPQEKQKGLILDESLRDGSFIKAGDGGRKNPVLTDSIDPGSTNGIVPDAPAVNKEGINAGVNRVPLLPQERQKGLFPVESFGDGIIIKAGDEMRKNSALADSIDPGSTEEIVPNAPVVNKEGSKADINIVPLVSQERQKRLFSVDSLKDSVFVKAGESEEKKRFLIDPFDLSPATDNAKEEGDYTAGTKISSLYRVNEDRQMAPAQEGLEKKDLIKNQETMGKVEAGQPQLFETSGSPGNSINPENNSAHKLPSAAHLQRSQEMVLPQEQIFTIKRHGPSSLEVFLEPEGLGKLNIELKMTDHHLHAQIMVNDSIGKELIENNLPQLLSELGKEGLQIGEFSVSLKNQGREQNQNQPTQTEYRVQSPGALDGTGGPLIDNNHLIHIII